jgi:holin-like protein
MKGILVFFGLSAVADGLSSALQLPVPGSIIGLVTLVVWFVRHGEVETAVAETAKVLMRGLPLFLVPVGVAVIDLVPRLDTEILTMIAVSVGALFVAILSTIAVAAVAQSLINCFAKSGRAGAACPPASC